MKRVHTFVIALLCFLITGVAGAQDQPILETYFGYSLLQVSSVSAFSQGDRLLDGGHAAITLFPAKRLGWTIDFGRNRGLLDIPEAFQDQYFAGRSSVETGQWSLTVGPRFRVLDSERFSLWAHGLLGAARDTRYELQPEFLDEAEVLWSPTVKKAFGFASIVGASTAVKLTDRFVWRTDLSWVHSRASRWDRNRARFSTGLGITWGR